MSSLAAAHQRFVATSSQDAKEDVVDTNYRELDKSASLLSLLAQQQASVFSDECTLFPPEILPSPDAPEIDHSSVQSLACVVKDLGEKLEVEQTKLKAFTDKFSSWGIPDNSGNLASSTENVWEELLEQTAAALQVLGSKNGCDDG